MTSRPTDRDAPQVGATLGRKYVVDGLIAEGGMAFVLLARDRSLDERVAIKTLKRKYREQPEWVSRFLREAKTIRRIQSDHCVKVLEVDSDPQHGPFIVMEYLEGLSLRSMLTSLKTVSARRASELVIQVCDALASAHAIGCIHRDIKPDNIIVLLRGDLELVRVLDFGISKHALTGSVLDQDLALVSTIDLMGTPTYMSPEQMRTSSTTDERADIWAVGAMLYEMVAGRPPFVARSVTELCSMVISDEPQPVKTLAPKIPDALAAAIHKCLRKNPAERFQNVGELAIALMEFAPRRSRASVEHVLATLTAAGVKVDRSHVSDHPLSSGAIPLLIPPSGQLPKEIPAFEPPDDSRDMPTLVRAKKSRLVWLLSAAAALLGIAIWVVVLGVRTRAPLSVQTPPSALHEPAGTVTVPAAPTSATSPGSDTPTGGDTPTSSVTTPPINSATAAPVVAPPATSPRPVAPAPLALPPPKPALVPSSRPKVLD